MVSLIMLTKSKKRIRSSSRAMSRSLDGRHQHVSSFTQRQQHLSCFKVRPCIFHVVITMSAVIIDEIKQWRISQTLITIVVARCNLGVCPLRVKKPSVILIGLSIWYPNQMWDLSIDRRTHGRRVGCFRRARRWQRPIYGCPLTSRRYLRWERILITVVCICIISTLKISCSYLWRPQDPGGPRWRCEVYPWRLNKWW